MHDRQLRDHVSRQRYLGVRPGQAILRSHERRSEESQAEGQALLPKLPPTRLAAALLGERIAERCVVDEVPETAADGPEDVRAERLPMGNGLLHHLAGRQLPLLALDESEPAGLELGQGRDRSKRGTQEADEAQARTD